LNAFPSDEQDGPERPGGEGLAVLDPIEELAEFRTVIVNPTREQQERLSGLLDLAERLEALTAWTREELLDNIGCDNRDPQELAEDPAKVRRCTDFLALILEAAQRVETVRARRSVIRGCARLSKATRRDVKGLREVLEAGDVSPFDYIELGELSAALRTARVTAGVEQPGSASGPSPYDDIAVVHLSVPRVDLYVRGERDVLGERTFEHMTEHIARCHACEDAVEIRRSLAHSR
jgi:hypothetical protein